MPRLPEPGYDSGTWGAILNDYLLAAHTADGSLKASSVTPSTLSANTPASGQVLSYNGTGFAWITNPAGVTDHGLLSGLTDDDHPQYHTDARGDARYYTQAQVDTSLSGKANTAHTHAIADVTNLQTTLDGKAATAHTHTAVEISDGTATGRALLTAATESAARTAIGVDVVYAGMPGAATRIAAGRVLGPLGVISDGFDFTIQDRLTLSRVVIAAPMTLVDAVINVTTAAAGGVVRCGIYNTKSDGLPGTLRFGNGTIDTDTTGDKAINFTAGTIVPGVYWIGSVIQGAAATTRRHLYYEAPAFVAPFGNQNSNYWTVDPYQQGFLYLEGVTGALPDLTSQTLTVTDVMLATVLRPA